MVNIRNISKKFTEAEGKQLLEGAQKIIDEKISAYTSKKKIGKTNCEKLYKYK